jgi:hypothetical protein
MREGVKPLGVMIYLRVMDAEKKRVEAWMLAAARKAGVPIPIGEIAGEDPGF